MIRKISCDADVEAGTAHLAKQHQVFSAILPQCGKIPLRLSTGDFEGLTSIIVSQQVSRASAIAIFNRLKTLVEPLTAEQFLKVGEETWIAAGLSRPKQRTLAALSVEICQNDLDLSVLPSLKPEDAMARLTAIKGIGPWTAEIYLMFCAGHCDIFPAGDLALQEAIRLALNLEQRPDEKSCRLISSHWAPWRSVAARILWDYYRVIKKDALPV